jgi:hypothetical protein
MSASAIPTPAAPNTQTAARNRVDGAPPGFGSGSLASEGGSDGNSDVNAGLRLQGVEAELLIYGDIPARTIPKS